jgi:phosphoglycolate phosphatase
MAGRIPGEIAAVVFDLDGTLIHSAPDIAAHLNAVLQEVGVSPFTEHEVLPFIGSGASRLITDAFAARGQHLPARDVTRLTARYLEIYRRDDSPRTVAFPQAADTLATLQRRGLGVAVCTNKPQAISDAVLLRLRLDNYIQAVIGSDSGFGRKPEPGPVWESCRRLGVPVDQALLVGDTAIDVAAARAAGLPVVVVRHGYSQKPVEHLGAEAILENLAELPALLALPAPC